MTNFAPYEGESTRAAPAATVGGARKALCIGINAYPRAPLDGCVNDAHSWAGFFRSQRFDTETLFDAQATRANIIGSIERLIATAKAGDIIAIQYSGHGTQLPDVSGDEGQEGMDEALVPCDHRQNGYVIDDDLGAAIDKTPAGVSLTFFMDCCHSGTNTRMFTAGGPPQRAFDEKARFLPADEEMIAVHRRTVKPQAERSLRSPYTNRAEVLYSACRSDEKALESGGHGHFTSRALKVLEGTGLGQLTNGGFMDQVRELFGPNPKQHPQLWSDPKYYEHALLAPRQAAAPSPAPSEDASSTTGDQSTSLLDRLKKLEERLRNLGA